MKIIVFPGIINTRVTTGSITGTFEKALPEADVDLRIWGVPLLSFHNLWAYDRNRKTARKIAQEIAQYRRPRPDSYVYLVGYSGGGAMAVFVTEALPDDVQIDRLILLAPAISPDYPLSPNVMSNVREFAVTFASERDRTVSWGTRLFGTMDKRRSFSAGFAGFENPPPRMIHVFWNDGMRKAGHGGSHLGYLSRRWLQQYVVDALNPEVTMNRFREMHQPPSQGR